MDFGANTLSSVAKKIVLKAEGVIGQAVGQLTSAIAGGAGIFSTGDSRIPNPLHDYALYNYLFSLSVLDDDSFNNATYRITGPTGPFLARSASIAPEDRVKTVYGKFEHFIEDVKINHVVGFDQTTGNTNAIGFSFKVIEPYSMGLFFQALQTDAIAKGWDNYIDAPLLLALEFKGHRDFYSQMITIPGTTKYFPLKIRMIDMKVSSRGCEYEIAAYPYNEYAFEKGKVTLNTDMSIAGKTVAEMLKTHATKSLELALNNRNKEQAKDKIVNEPDQYEIEFPLRNSIPIDETADPNQVLFNEIGNSSMGFDLYNSGKTPFGDDNLIYENGIYKRGNLSINPAVSEFSFGQGSDIINAINQVILMSDYGRSALTKITADGFVNWWRVETNIKNISTNENISKTGTKPRKIIYRVVPYQVDSSYFLPPNERRKGTEEDKFQVLKEYNYIYSGKNTDILSFDINFKTGFYTVITADGGKDTAAEALRTSTSSTAKPEPARTAIQASDGEKVAGRNEIVVQQSATATTTTTTNKGGAGAKESPAATAAKQFYDAISAGVDMINVDMTILGDPYYIGDSGVGNYSAGPGANKYINSDSAMNWDNSEIHILLNFKTPVDNGASNGTGLYDFGNTYQVPQFSGLYRVYMGESNFVRGKFTQTLKVMRLRNQESESGTGVLSQQPTRTEADQTAEPASSETSAQQTQPQTNTETPPTP